jgi:hypothetical protein
MKLGFIHLDCHEWFFQGGWAIEIFCVGVTNLAIIGTELLNNLTVN